MVPSVVAIDRNKGYVLAVGKEAKKYDWPHPGEYLRYSPH